MKKTNLYIHKRSFHWLYKWVIYDYWNVNRFVKCFREGRLSVDEDSTLMTFY